MARFVHKVVTVVTSRERSELTRALERAKEISLFDQGVAMFHCTTIDGPKHHHRTIIMLALVVGICAACDSDPDNSYTYKSCEKGLVATHTCSGGICDPMPFVECGGGTCVHQPGTCSGDAGVDASVSDSGKAHTFPCCENEKVTTCSCTGGPCTPTPFTDCGGGTCVVLPATCSADGGPD